jgi:hypothetical protein
MNFNRCAIFIDSAYLEKILKNEFNERRINFEKFSKNLDGDYQILRTYYYHCMPFQDDPPTSEQRTKYTNKDRFINSIKRYENYEIRLGKLKRGTCDFCKHENFE